MHDHPDLRPPTSVPRGMRVVTVLMPAEALDVVREAARLEKDSLSAFCATAIWRATVRTLSARDERLAEKGSMVEGGESRAGS